MIYVDKNVRVAFERAWHTMFFRSNVLPNPRLSTYVRTRVYRSWCPEFVMARSCAYVRITPSHVFQKLWFSHLIQLHDIDHLPKPWKSYEFAQAGTRKSHNLQSQSYVRLFISLCKFARLSSPSSNSQTLVSFNSGAVSIGTFAKYRYYNNFCN